MRNNETLPLTVANTGFLLDRMGQDCAPLQFVRELTQNSIESILRVRQNNPDFEGKVLWDVDWTTYDLEGGPHKLSIIDNGDGMTGADMVKFINQLSSSGSEQALTGNYGVGAKIAAATQNRHGLLYVSWRDSRGAMVHLWRDPETGIYGLRQFERPDGTYGHSSGVDNDLRPEMIHGHGTKVVLLGNSAEQNTMLAPEGWGAKDRWIQRYLNTRYFRFPEGITISAREGLQKPGRRKRGLIRNAYGQGHFLENASIERGSVTLSNAIAHWWIVKPTKELVTEGPSYETTGHIAALHQDELYEMATGRSGRAFLQQFGVLFGTNRVVIYVEPADDLDVTTNTARTQLLVDGDGLPWADWAAEFRERMPSEIRQLMEEVAGEAVSKDHQKTVRDRLRPLLSLYQVSRYRLAPNGATSTEPSTTGGGEDSGRRERSSGGTGRRGHSRGKGGTAGGVYGVFQTNDGESAHRVSPDAFPEVRWVSARSDPPTREDGDIEDRAARYRPEQNVLLINEDFRVFDDLIDHLAKHFEGKAAAKEVCRSVVHGWVEQTLVEAVIGVQALRESKEWDEHSVEHALSEESLTTAVLPRYHVYNAAKRDVAVKLGRAA